MSIDGGDGLSNVQRGDVARLHQLFDQPLASRVAIELRAISNANVLLRILPLEQLFPESIALRTTVRYLARWKVGEEGVHLDKVGVRVGVCVGTRTQRK